MKYLFYDIFLKMVTVIFIGFWNDKISETIPTTNFPKHVQLRFLDYTKLRYLLGRSQCIEFQPSGLSLNGLV